MSDYEFHKGTLKPLTLSEGETYEDKAKKICNNNGVEKLPNYCDTYLEYIRDRNFDNYTVLNNSIYEIDNSELDPYSDVQELVDNKDGTYSYIMKFHNGGTYLEEMLEESLHKLENKEL
ncbi:MAG: hypothetical protein KC414_13045 [Romboutsia sp.]|nr:hypothetical protein [Romboutsia sp.]